MSIHPAPKTAKQLLVIMIVEHHGDEVVRARRPGRVEVAPRVPGGYQWYVGTKPRRLVGPMEALDEGFIRLESVLRKLIQ